MSRLLITGGAGFIGAHLVEALAPGRDDIIVFDNLKRGSRARIQHHISYDGVMFVEGDIRDREALLEAARDCDVIYHLAAQSNVMGALDDPDYSFTTNTVGTYNVLRAAVEAGVPRVVFSSSREVYGEPEYIPVDEFHPLAAKNPYGASKLAGEAYCRTFANCHDIDVAVLRLANVYGSGDTGRVIPLWLRAAAEGRDLQVYGGSQILDLIWVDTVVAALRHAAEYGVPGPTNIGSGHGTSILELGQRIIEISGSKSQLVRTASRGAEVTRFIADVSRMRELGLEPPSDPLENLARLAADFSAVPA